MLIEDYPNLSRQRRRFITQADLRLVQRPEGTAGVVLVDIAARRLHSEQSAVERPLPRGPWPLIAYASTYDPRTLRWLRRRGYAGVLVKAGCPRTLRKGLDDILNRCAPSLPCRTAARRPVRKCTVRGRALVVDDDPLNLQVMRHFCAVLELGVDCASSVTEAIELMHTARYTLIFTDVHMPAVGGHAIARAVRNAPSPRAAIVALTADSCLQHARLCELGFDGLLRKPVSLRQLRSCVQRHHANRVPRAGSDCREARVAELRTALRERLPSERAALQALVRTSRYSHLAFAAHRLHGATLYCDVPELTDAVRRLERGARAANAALTAVALADALMAIDRFLASCKPYPPSHQLGIWQ